MKKNSVVSAIITYFVIIICIIGINLVFTIPLKDANQTINQLDKISNEQVIEYIESCRIYCKAFANMTVALLAIISLALVVVGLSLRVNKARNKGIYNAIIFAGITTIFYLIYFIIIVSNAFEVLF